MQAKERMVKGLELFTDCSRAELDWVVKHSDEIYLGPGTTIARKGSVAREFVIVVDGLVTSTGNGTAAIVKPGATIGAEEISADRRHSKTVETASDVRVLVFEVRAFRSFADSAPSVTRKLSAGVATTVLAPVRYGRRLVVAS